MTIPLSTAIGRHYAVHAGVQVGVSVGDAQEIDVLQFAGGAIHVPGGSGLTAVTLYAAAWPGGTYQPLHDKAGNPVTMTVTAHRLQVLSDAIYSVGALKLVGNVAGTVDVVVKG